jgi:hypothetical protein
MNKNGSPVPWEYNIRTTWEIFDVKPETKTCSMQKRPNSFLRQGISGTNFGHVPASMFVGDFVRQGNRPIYVQANSEEWPHCSSLYLKPAC